jgi:hypothetical protein
MPSCLFCGSDADDLIPYEPPESVEAPEGALPFVVDDATARGAFQKFARGSFWYPNELRNAKLSLRRLQLPAWAWNGRIETHFTALVRASTRSGKAPIAGAETLAFHQVLVPSSATLTMRELAQLGRYDEHSLQAWDAAATEDPYELSETTRSAARASALAEMERRHGADLAARHATSTIRVSVIPLELEGRPVLVPVWIGAYRWGDRIYRVLINGQSGQLWATAPTSWWKVAGVVCVVLLLIGAILACFGAFSGGALLLGS